MKHYTLRLTIYKAGYNPKYGKILIKIKSFLGNDKAVLLEKFELWFIKQGYDRSDIEMHFESVQHANNI